MEGDWIVCDRQKMIGGLFTDQDSAIHFAEAETNRVPGAVWCMGDETCLLANPWDDLKPNECADKKHALQANHRCEAGRKTSGPGTNRTAVPKDMF